MWSIGFFWHPAKCYLVICNGGNVSCQKMVPGNGVWERQRKLEWRQETEREEEEITEKGRQPLWEISRLRLHLKSDPQQFHCCAFLCRRLLFAHISVFSKPVSKTESQSESRGACTLCAAAKQHNVRSCSSKVVYFYWFFGNSEAETEGANTKRDNSTTATYVVFQGDTVATITLHTSSLSLSSARCSFSRHKRLALSTASAVFHSWKPNATLDGGDSCWEVPVKPFLWTTPRASSCQQKHDIITCEAEFFPLATVAYVCCEVSPNWFCACQTVLSAVHSATCAGTTISVISFASTGNSAFSEFNTCHKGNNWKRNESENRDKKTKRSNICNNGAAAHNRAGTSLFVCCYLLLLTRWYKDDLCGIIKTVQDSMTINHLVQILMHFVMSAGNIHILHRVMASRELRENKPSLKFSSLSSDRVCSLSKWL